MEFDKLKHIYFLGIGGIGMSSLARYFNHLGIRVSGYDKTETDLTIALEKEGIFIHYQEDIHQIKSDIDLVIYTPAIPKDSIELNHILQIKIPMRKRAEVLGMISKQFKSIAVAGTHGKTTTTSMIAHIMYQSHLGCQAFVGGILSNYQSNLLLHKNSNWVVLEADEYDRSFMQIFPTIAIINSVDADHLDIYGTAQEVEDSYIAFSKQVEPNGHLLCHHSIRHLFNHCNYSFSFSDSEADVYVAKKIDAIEYEIFIRPLNEYMQISCQLPGKHNIENMLAAVLACRLAGLAADEIQAGTKSFKGIKRRFEIIDQNSSFVLIDDYAHHPSEIESAIKAAKDFYPNKKITVAFQPHLFSRTRDFKEQFAQSLSLADSLFLLDIYPAREKPIVGVTSSDLLESIPLKDKRLVSKQELPGFLSKELPSIVLVLGAGDIDVCVEAIRQEFLKHP